jgi:hypothetical protein
MVHFVNLHNKLVGVALLLGMFASPAAALSNCWTHVGSGSQHGCSPGCPMMARRVAVPAITVHSQPENSGCCQIKSDKLPLAPQVLAPTRQSRISPPATQVMAAQDVIAPMPIHPSDTAPSTPLAPSQSVLCTFLI